MQDQLLVLDGIDMKSAVGEQHQAGMVACNLRTRQGSCEGPSVDQVIASRIRGDRT